MTALQRGALEAFGGLVKLQRVARQLSQEKLGELAGLDRTYISGIERGVRNPSLTALLSLASGLDVSVSHLINGLEGAIASRG